MRAQALVTLFLSTLAIAGPMAAPEEPADNLAAREDGAPLDARACTYNGCSCTTGSSGQYCGWSSNVISLGSGGRLDGIYQCNTSGGCCYYGYANKCA
jgi:hypothetical protein